MNREFKLKEKLTIKGIKRDEKDTEVKIREIKGNDILLEFKEKRSYTHNDNGRYDEELYYWIGKDELRNIIVEKEAR